MPPSACKQGSVALFCTQHKSTRSLLLATAGKVVARLSLGSVAMLMKVYEGQELGEVS